MQPLLTARWFNAGHLLSLTWASLKTGLACVLFGVMLGGCSPPARMEAQHEDKPIRIGLAYWPGQYWVDVALRKDWFAAEGLRVEGVDTTEDYIGSLKAVAEGRLDIQLFVLFDLVRYHQQGADIVMVMCNDFSRGADGIAGRSGLRGIRDLVGRRIGVPRGTSSEYLLHLALERENISLSEVTLVDMHAEKATEVLSAGEVDAVCTWAPFLQQSARAVSGTLLWDTSVMPGAMPAGYAVRRDFLQRRPGDVAALVRVWHRAQRYIDEHPEEAYAIVAEMNGRTPAEVAELAKLDLVLNRQDNLLVFSYNSGAQSLHSVARHVGSFMVEQGLTTRRIDTSRLFDASFVRSLQ